MELWERATFAHDDGFTVSGDCVFADVDGLCLNGSSRRYSLRVRGDMLARGGFWSVTMYDADSMGLIENEIDRHVVHSHMVGSMSRDADEGLTIWLQSTSPGSLRQANWLPAPSGPFYLVFRVFLPVPDYLSPEWRLPVVRRR